MAYYFIFESMLYKQCFREISFLTMKMTYMGLKTNSVQMLLLNHWLLIMLIGIDTV